MIIYNDELMFDDDANEKLSKLKNAIPEIDPNVYVGNRNTLNLEI